MAAARAACRTRATPRKETRPKTKGTVNEVGDHNSGVVLLMAAPEASRLIDPFLAQSDTNCLTLRESFPPCISIGIKRIRQHIAIGRFSITVVELAWDNANNHTRSSNHENYTNQVLIK